MWKSVRLNKYLKYELSLKANLWMYNIILENNLGLNLYVMPITCYVIIISKNQGLIRREFLSSSYLILARRILENS